MIDYIDGFVFPIPKKHLQEYRSIASEMANIWKEHGAIAYHECFGEDLHLKGTRSFTDLVEAKEDEVVIFGWVVFDSKESRERANLLVPNDPRMNKLVAPLIDPSRLIFDASRMVYGGFKGLV